MKHCAIIFVLLAVIGGDNASASCFLPNPLAAMSNMTDSSGLKWVKHTSLYSNEVIVLPSGLAGIMSERSASGVYRMAILLICPTSIIRMAQRRIHPVAVASADRLQRMASFLRTCHEAFGRLPTPR
jgi:hypothetical protein